MGMMGFQTLNAISLMLDGVVGRFVGRFFKPGKSENACPTNKVVVLSAVFYLILALSERATSVQNWARQNPPFLRFQRQRACAEATLVQRGPM
jgi:hypothetical protein